MTNSSHDEFVKLHKDEDLRRMNDLEVEINRLIDRFETNHPGWTVEIDRYNVWGPVRKEDLGKATMIPSGIPVHADDIFQPLE